MEILALTFCRGRVSVEHAQRQVKSAAESGAGAMADGQDVREA